MASELTAKQQRFIDEYLLDLNASAAYKRAGYVAEGNSAEVSASKLLRNPKVAECIQKAMDERAKKVGVSAEYVLNTIIDTIERCKQASPVLDRKGEHVYVSTPNGEILPAYTFEANAVLKGAELLGKHLKMFTDKTELTGDGGGPLVVEVVRFGSDKTAK